MEEHILCQTPDCEEAQFSTRSDETYWILHQTRLHTYVRLDDQDHYLWTLMDGTHTTIDLIIQFQNRFNSTPFSRLQCLIPRLSGHGLLKTPTLPALGPPVELTRSSPSYTGAEEKIPGTHIGEQITGKSNRFWEILFPIPDIDRYITRLFHLISPILRSPLSFLLFILVSLTGLGYFLITEPLPQYPLLLEVDLQVITIIVTYITLLATAVLHECGHAIACKYYGRRINNAGVVLYYGSPCLYVDTTDIWMAPPRARIITSLAGPAVNLFIGAVCSLVVLGFPYSPYSTDIWRFAFISYLLALVNLNPLLEFDGYYALTDLLELPNLRSRAFAYIRSFSFISMMRKDTVFDKTGLIYLLYGVLGGLYTLCMVVISLYIWEAHVQDLADEILLNRFEMDHFLTSLVIVVLFLPFMIGMILQGVSYVRTQVRHRYLK